MPRLGTGRRGTDGGDGRVAGVRRWAPACRGPPRAGLGPGARRWYLGRPVRVRSGAPPRARTHCQKNSLLRDTRGSRVANIKSQIKRNKTNEKARQRNVAVKSALRTAVRRVHSAAASGDADAAATALQTASKALDKAASKGVIHKNQAANRKSGLAKQVAGI